MQLSRHGRSQPSVAVAPVERARLRPLDGVCGLGHRRLKPAVVVARPVAISSARACSRERIDGGGCGWEPATPVTGKPYARRKRAAGGPLDSY